MDENEYRTEMKPGGPIRVAGPELPGPRGDRKFVRKVVLGWSLLGVLLVGGLTFMLLPNSPAPDRVTPLPSPAAVSPGSEPTESPEQSLTSAAADFIAEHPYSEENGARLRLIFETSGCAVEALDILEGVNRQPLMPGVYQEVRRYGPKYDESEGKPFTFLLKVSC